MNKLRWGDYPALSEKLQWCVHKVPSEQEGQRTRGKKHTVRQLLTKECQINLQKLEKARNRFHPATSLQPTLQIQGWCSDFPEMQESQVVLFWTTFTVMCYRDRRKLKPRAWSSMKKDWFKSALANLTHEPKEHQDAAELTVFVTFPETPKHTPMWEDRAGIMVLFVQHCIPSTQNTAWHIVGAQQYLINYWKSGETR